MISGSHDRLRQWQDEVARDPGADAFVPLADLYRAQGRLDVARRVAVRGLERNPEHVEGHYVLGRIYRDSDEPERAYDEWDIALGLDASHLPSRRAMAFLCLERGESAQAQEHLTKAIQLEPDDPRLRRALDRISRGTDGRGIGSSYWGSAAPALDEAIERFVRETRVRLVLIIDHSGQVVAQQGFTRELDLAAFASLAAAVHAASGELARLLEQEAFAQLYQGSGEHQLFMGDLALPPAPLLLLAVFGADSTIGLVRAVYGELSRELQDIEWPQRGEPTPADAFEADLARGARRAIRSWDANRSGGAE
ncbi:MAG: tetratricopeptide repeat protein [Gemmatimonadota bacterium]